jgi:hypothetical protein
MNMYELFSLHERLNFFHRRTWLEVLIQNDSHLILRQVLRKVAWHGPDGTAAGEEAGKE